MSQAFVNCVPHVTEPHTVLHKQVQLKCCNQVCVLSKMQNLSIVSVTKNNNVAQSFSLLFTEITPMW
jgi:hypothetical protein